MTSHNTDVTAN